MADLLSGAARVIVVGLFLVGAVGLAYLLGLLGLTIIAAVLERPLRGRTRLIVVPIILVVALLAWRLDLRQFSYGGAAVLGLAASFIWLRNLLRGETWIMPHEGRINSEYIGPVALILLSVFFLWSAVTPFF